MATGTYRYSMSKPEASDSAVPDLFNNNFDFIDSKLYELDGYKARIDDLIPVVQNNTTAIATCETTCKAYTDAAIGDLSSILDEINGEVI